jgi:hypothetical protein
MLSRFPAAFRPPAFASWVVLRPLEDPAFLTVGVPDDEPYAAPDPNGVRGLLTLQDPKQFLFFTRTPNGRRAGKQFLARLKERTENRDKAISVRSYLNQLSAIHSWGLERPHDLSTVTQPVLVANGESGRRDLPVPRAVRRASFCLPTGVAPHADGPLDVEGAVPWTGLATSRARDRRPRGSAKEREGVREAALEDLVGQAMVGQCA